MATGKIIIYDSKLFYRAYIMDILQKEGYEVEGVEQLRALPRAVQTFCPDLVVIDIAELRDKDTDFLNALKKSFPTMPVIILVDAERKELVAKYIRLGVFDCVLKPVIKEDLLLAAEKSVEFADFRKQETVRLSRLRKLAVGAESLFGVTREKIMNVPFRFPGNRVIQSILDSIAAVFDAEKVSLSWLDRAKGKYYVVASAGYDIDLKTFKPRAIGEGIVGRVADSREAIYVKDIRSDGRFRSSPFRDQYKSNSFMCGPVMLLDEVAAVVNVSDRKDGRGYAEEDFLLFKSFLSQISYVVESSVLIDSLEQNTMRLDLYKELSGHIVNLVESGDIMRNMLAAVNKYFRVQGSALFVMDENREFFVNEGDAGIGFVARIAHHEFLNKFLTDRQSSASGKHLVRIVEKMTKNVDVRNFFTEPIRLKSFPLGFLLLVNEEDGDLDAPTLADVSQLLSVAFKNNWLYKNLCATADELVRTSRESERAAGSRGAGKAPGK